MGMIAKLGLNGSPSESDLYFGRGPSSVLSNTFTYYEFNPIEVCLEAENKDIL